MEKIYIFMCMENEPIIEIMKWHVTQKKRKKKIPGLPPGTLLLENPENRDRNIACLTYNSESIKEELINTAGSFPDLQQKGLVSWLRIKDIAKSDVVREIGNTLNLHSLILEDILNPGQRTKLNDFDDYLFIILNFPHFNRNTKDYFEEQISLVLYSDFVVTFQENGGESLNPIEERLKQNRGRIRKMRADYLAYSLIDLVVDHYFPVIEEVEEELELLEEGMATADSMVLMQEIFKLKQIVIRLRRSIMPIREIIRTLEHRQEGLVKKDTIVFLHDVYEHTVQIIEDLESFREKLSSVHDVYLSTISNRMNEVMKVLTMFASIFIPLSFLAGLYGMNFKHMPELEWPWGYPVLLTIMGSVALSMLLFFKKKKWIWSRKKKSG